MGTNIASHAVAVDETGQPKWSLEKPKVSRTNDPSTPGSDSSWYWAGSNWGRMPGVPSAGGAGVAPSTSAVMGAGGMGGGADPEAPPIKDTRGGGPSRGGFSGGGFGGGGALPGGSAAQSLAGLKSAAPGGMGDTSEGSVPYEPAGLHRAGDPPGLYRPPLGTRSFIPLQGLTYGMKF